MAKREDILGILAGETGPMNRTVLSKRLGEPTSNFQNQLDRMVKQDLLEKNTQNEYTITEAGRQFAAAEPPEKAEETPPSEAPTEESLKTTEYQQFVQMGKTTGVVPPALIEQVATHIWRGGDFRDLTWVWKGLTEMGIRPDLAQRWFHSWRSFLHQAIPPELAASVGTPITEKGKEVAEVKGKRDHIIDANGLPVYVGEGMGDLDHDEAVRLSALRQIALARGGGQAGQTGQPVTPGTMADEVVKIANALRASAGPEAKGKSYIVKPGEGGYHVEEIDESKPTIITAPGGGSAKPSSTFIVDGDEVVELPAGKPIIIKQAVAPVAPSTAGKTYVIRQTADGVKTEEYEAGKPIILESGSPSLGGVSTLPFPVFGNDGKPVYDSDGRPVYANLEPTLRWLEFQGNQRRADGRHEALMGLAKTVKENLGDGIAALKAAADEAKGSAKGKSQKEQPQVFKCGDCGAEFSPPPEWEGQPLQCPGCKREYSKEELEK